MALLKEILDMSPMPFKWLGDNRCVFEFENNKFGIFVSLMEIKIQEVNLVASVANISFGTFENTFNNEQDLKTDLTGLNKPRVIFLLLELLVQKIKKFLIVI